ncbi:MAG: cytochrome c3 family protein [Catalinimonas sp.]
MVALFLSVPAFAQDGESGMAPDGATPTEEPAAAPMNDAENVSADAPAGAGGEFDQALVQQGSELFTNNCTQCHALNEEVVGPALRDSHKRWDSDAQLINFIRYPQKVIESGHPHAVALYEQYKQYMPNHDFLSEAEVGSIVEWIKAESAQPVAKVPAGGNGGGPGTMVNGEGAAVGAGVPGGEYLVFILGGLLLVLLLVLLVLVLMLSVLSKFLNQEGRMDADDREYVNQKTDWKGILTSNVVKGGVAFVAILILGKVAFDAVYSIGVQQHYAPTQPIAFSHKLHVGAYEINCAYCHTGVYKAKSANIPSANICMNCHNQIKTNSPEIQKIWQAVETGKPIEWIRVHNLPDLAYFNHSQHTTVGGLECTTCHGQIQEMEVVEQHSTLTMGWCINCHRETVVNADGNAYYDKLLELHDAETGGAPMHVADIGGLECSKCHY